MVSTKSISTGALIGAQEFQLEMFFYKRDLIDSIEHQSNANFLYLTGWEFFEKELYLHVKKLQQLQFITNLWH